MTQGFNVGLAYLASSLEEAGHAVEVVDLNNRTDRSEQRVADIKADVAGISLKSAIIAITDPIIDLMCENTSIGWRFCGGPHITVAGAEFMEQYPLFDVGFSGESEYAVSRVLEIIENHGDFSSVENIWYRAERGGALKRSTGKPARIADLDSLPFARFEVFDSYEGKVEDYPLLTSRGCPYKCIYCSVCEVSGRTWRARSVDSVIEELRRAKNHYGASKFHLIDDNFTMNMKRAKSFCEELIRQDLNLEWSCPNGVRADRLDDELLGLMKRSGCAAINVGIESGVERIFAVLKKGETLADVDKAVRAAKKAGIEVNGFFIIGLPGATIEDDLRSLQYSFELGLDDALFNLLNIYPGTELWDMVHQDEEMRILKDWKSAFHFGKVEPVIDSEDYPAEDRKRMFYMANLKRRHYLVVVGETGNLMARAMQLLMIILKYDRSSFFSHLWHLVSNYRKIIQYA
jgi:radical SAM superfamily enzyme YgiQ (UPF0313 family)